jgi:alpha-amylase
LYLHAHQPQRLKNISIFDLGTTTKYFDRSKLNDGSNKSIFNKVATKSYLPTNKMLLKLMKKYKNFNVNLSITGTLVEQANSYDKNVLDSFVNLTKTNQCEIIAETYYHSLASMYSNEEFKTQVNKHLKMVNKHFSQKPKVFRNTELIYSDDIAQKVSNMGFKTIITEGHEKTLGWRSPNYLYKANTKNDLHLMLKNYKLSDDIAWRFSNKNWKEYPLTANKFLHWIDNTPGDTINLFKDFETYGEHQWEDTNIFNFLEEFVEKACNKGYEFIKLSEAPKKLNNKGVISSPNTISWADEERDTSAWTENHMQQESIRNIYKIEDQVKKSKNKKLINVWRKMQTSDHFYYMCTKCFNDGDAHKYFSPYQTPHDAYNTYNNAYIELISQLKEV